MAELNYNQQTDELEKDFSVVPTGDYIAVITESDYLPNSKGTGMNLQLKWEIIDGEFKGSKLFENLSLEHEKQKTAIIAQQAFNSIKAAAGVQVVKDSAQLHNIPMMLTVKYTEGEQFPNSIKKHLPVSGQAPAAPAQTGFQKPATQGSEAGTNKKQPWMK
jgi:hypothetical protein